MSSTEIPQALWFEVMGPNGSPAKGDFLPISNVSWFQAVDFCNRLSLRDNLVPAYVINGKAVSWNRSASGYRLPTEAEWEYAARGGTRNQNVAYAGGSNPDQFAWYKKNSANSPQQVGTKKANQLGLFDMSGNVAEWCWNWYGSGYGKAKESDPTGPSDGAERVIRGGSFSDDASGIMVLGRGYALPDGRFADLGFRVVRGSS
jgi:formylglycine-generating enzyme required for sulfatase activity